MSGVERIKPRDGVIDLVLLKALYGIIPQICLNGYRKRPKIALTILYAGYYNEIKLLMR